MSPTQEELIVDFAELQLIGIVCSQCGTELTLDCLNERAFAPSECPSCKEAFDAIGIRQQLEQYRGLYRSLSKGKHKIRLHLKSSSAQK